MNCIAIDTTSTRLTVALIKGDETYFDEREVGKSGHSSLLMPAVSALIAEHGMSAGDIDTVAAVVGPGSFTGIRIGVAAMTAMAYALGAKRIAVTSFELIAYNRDDVLAAVDAGHGNVYLAHCRGGRVVTTEFADHPVEGAQYDICGDPAQTLAAVVRAKAAAGEYVKVLEPFYMRKSQAEREKDEI